jgi:hypothetical protein
MARNIFDPELFFRQSAHYASQARGLFTCNPLTNVALDDYIGADIIAQRGFRQLSEGIVTKATQISAQQLATYEATSFIGPTRKVPYGQIFTDIGVEFLMMDATKGNAGSVYSALTKWQEFIAGPSSRSISSTVISDFTGFGVRYYDEYVTDARIQLFSPTDSDKPELELLLTEAYPITIGSLQTSWDSPDAPLSLQVSFAYHYMQIIN